MRERTSLKIELLFHAALLFALIGAVAFCCISANSAAEAADNTQDNTTEADAPPAITEVAEGEQADIAHCVALYDVPLEADAQLHLMQLCEENGLEPAVVMGIVKVESQYDAGAIGDNGNALGLMQIQPRWHRERMERLGVTDLLDPCQNITVGVDYLTELLDYYDGHIDKALVAYNAGQTGAYNGWFKYGICSSDYSRKVLAAAKEIEEGARYMYYSDDPVRDFERYDAEQNRRIEQRPHCADCGEAIQDETAYYINGEFICKTCMDAYLVNVEDYTE